jgi:CheY-like chemotaxis protein
LLRMISHRAPCSRRSSRQRGFGVVAVCAGEEAWAQLRKPDGPKLALLDWMMPGMDGVEVCRNLETSRETRE